MKAIIVQTKDKYMAEGQDDNLDWAKGQDKYIFKLCSILCQVNICGKNTYSLLPMGMKRDKYRKFIIAEKTGKNSLIELNKRYPDAIFIGGPKLLKIAKDLKIIDLIIINTLNIESINKNIIYKTPFEDNELEQISQIKFFDNIETKIYKCIYKNKGIVDE